MALQNPITSFRPRIISVKNILRKGEEGEYPPIPQTKTLRKKQVYLFQNDSWLFSVYFFPFWDLEFSFQVSDFLQKEQTGHKKQMQPN